MIITSSLGFVAQTFCHRPFQALCLSESCNTLSVALTLPLSFLLPTGHAAHHISVLFCAITFSQFPPAQPLCSLPMVIWVHFPLSCHSFAVCYSLSLTKKGWFFWQTWNVCRLRCYLGWSFNIVKHVCGHMQFSQSLKLAPHSASSQERLLHMHTRTHAYAHIHTKFL